VVKGKADNDVSYAPEQDERETDLLQHVTKTHQGSVNNAVRSLALLAELCDTRRKTLLFIGDEFLNLVCVGVSLLCPKHFGTL
jgi:hypothetical protein